MDKIMIYDYITKTREHINKVREILDNFDCHNDAVLRSELKQRAFNHDSSKIMNTQEFEKQLAFSEEISKCNFVTAEYKECIKRNKDTIDLHYKNNDHHPEHYENGYEDMPRGARIEMLSDWLACAIRAHDSQEKFAKSIVSQCVRFSIKGEENLVELLMWLDDMHVEKYLA